MVFPLEKILPISAQDYVGVRNYVQSRYNVKSVTVAGNLDSLNSKKSPKLELSRIVPRGTEVVVDYHVEMVTKGGGSGKIFYEANGVALIPKPKMKIGGPPPHDYGPGC